MRKYLDKQTRHEKIRHLNRRYHKRFGRYKHNPDGVNLLSQDWDQCILLDACRYDMFEEQYEQHGLEGTLSRTVSQVSSTNELIRAVLDGDHHDTVYVTSNPMLARHRDKTDVEFHAEFHVWQDAGWDETYRTVLPETMVEYTRKAASQFPSKRLLIHFMQPHYPFITTETDFDKTVPDPEGETNFWVRIKRGELDVGPDDIWPHYRANLDEVLPYVDELLSELPGKSVVTSDHGNHVGERAFPIPIKEWGHPWGTYTRELVEVPWFVSTNEERKTTTADDPIAPREHDEDTVNNRLEALGYR